MIAFDSTAQPNRISSWVGVAKIEPLESRWWSPLNWLSSFSAVQPMVKLPSFAEQAKRPVSYGTQSQTRIGDQPCSCSVPTHGNPIPCRSNMLATRIVSAFVCPRDRAQQLVISIRDFHANGEPTTLNVDSG